ncbi:MAG: adenosylcobinamide-GDP ribazoletransferase [Firmicutes bacterium]|nr:adenosylcobinamide-GDP ribazoletransferase [Candidatus Fermentithermobacillaceae bacterium]
MDENENARKGITSECEVDSIWPSDPDKSPGKYVPNPVRRLWAGVGFLTKIPVPTWIAMDADSLSLSPPYFPAVGAIIGLGLALFDRLFAVLLPAPAVCAMDLVFMFLLTGGIHWDGLIDSADGLLGSHTREDALRIMRDSRIGALGAITMVILIITKYSLLVSIPLLSPEANRLTACPRFQALMVSPILARWCMYLVMRVFPYARKEGGLGSLFARPPKCEETGDEETRLSVTTDLILPGVLTAACAMAIASARGLCAFILCSLAALLGGWRMSHFLHGLTGDTYGAICEVCEILALIVFCIEI